MPGKPKLYAHQVKILKDVKAGNAGRFANEREGFEPSVLVLARTTV
jgi:hypothetical protein